MLPAVTDCICSGQLEQVQALVDGERLGRRLGQLALLAEVEEHVVGEHLAQHAGDEDLLADDPVEVAAGQAVPLADELQRIGAADRLDPGVEHRAGPLGVVDGLAQVDLDPADDGAEVEEAEQVDLGVVVDLQAGQPLIVCTSSWAPPACRTSSDALAGVSA
jgi:hypothetical protein